MFNAFPVHLKGARSTKGRSNCRRIATPGSWAKKTPVFSAVLLVSYDFRMNKMVVVFGAPKWNSNVYTLQKKVCLDPGGSGRSCRQPSGSSGGQGSFGAAFKDSFWGSFGSRATSLILSWETHRDSCVKLCLLKLWLRMKRFWFMSIVNAWMTVKIIVDHFSRRGPFLVKKCTQLRKAIGPPPKAITCTFCYILLFAGILLYGRI